MNTVDNTLTELLQHGADQYLLLRVGSSTSGSEHVLAGDLDYICIRPGELRLEHEKELTAMMDSFVNVGGVIGFVPRWLNADSCLPQAMQSRLRDFQIDFHFGPVASEGSDTTKQSIHFAGPITLGDYLYFREAFPVLGYIFETYQKCLLGDASVINCRTRRPSIEQFAKLTLLNCERFSRAPNAHVSGMAIKKVLLLRAIWQKLADPYESSRLDWKKVIGRETKLLDCVVADAARYLECAAPIEQLVN